MRGAPHQRGESYGLQAKKRIVRTIEIYRDLFRFYSGLDWARVKEYSSRYLPIISEYNSDLIDEMRGIANGAGVAFEDILAINVRTEVMYGLGELKAAAECTAFCVLPEAAESGQLLLGQNWDWHPSAAESCVVLQIDEGESSPAITTVVEAGLIGKFGLNSEGVGVVTNALVSDIDRGEPGIPYHVLLRTILSSTCFQDAVDVVLSAKRSSSANYLIASKSGSAIDLEAAPGEVDAVFAIGPSDGTLAHANCFIAPNLTVEDETRRLRPLSQIRQRTMETHLASGGDAITLDYLQEILRDHAYEPNSICRHPIDSMPDQDRSATVASTVMNLDEGVMWLADGQPCSHPFRRIDFNSDVAVDSVA